MFTALEELEIYSDPSNVETIEEQSSPENC